MGRLENFDTDGVTFLSELDLDTWNHFDEFVSPASNRPDVHGATYSIIPWRRHSPLGEQLMRWHPRDFAVAPDHDGITGSGMISDGPRHSPPESFLSLDVDETDAPLQTAVLSHWFTVVAARSACSVSTPLARRGLGEFILS